MSGSDSGDSNFSPDASQQLNSDYEEDSFEPSSGTTDSDDEPAPKRPKRKVPKKSRKHYEWKSNSTPPSNVSLKCSTKVKEEHISTDPLTIFYKFFDEPFIQLVSKLTNENASRSGKNLELTEIELKAYFGMLMIMSFHRLPRLSHYWHSDQNLCVSRINKIMRLRRFVDIGNCLCFSTACKKGARAETDFVLVQPLLDHLNEKFCQIRHPCHPLTIDESTVRPKNVYEKLQRSGEKKFSVMAVGCGKTGYIFRVNVRPMGTDVDNRVRDLMLPFEGGGYRVFVARKQSNFPLVEELYEKKVLVCCELEQNDPNIPGDLRGKRLKIETGEFVQCGDFSITKWKDSQRHYAYILSSFHDPGKKYEIEQASEAETRNSSESEEEERPSLSSEMGAKRAAKKASYPQVVMDYYTLKRSIATSDHRRLMYTTSWKCYSWTKRLFYYMLDVTLANSHLVYASSHDPTTGRRLSAVEFRSELADRIVDGYENGQKDTNEARVRREIHNLKKTKARGVHSTVKSSARLVDVGRHLPVKSSVRRCANCSMRGKQKRSTVSCKECHVGLCIPCFVPFHTS